ncbi:hypothetical protein GYMLUDRAFT_70539 [Collybiopsis luxurians FD-317 M1]|nr:hypothetical protein GYMLUDRAFT_70539 [Collybiopsis luxurians FD-317 M1]
MTSDYPQIHLPVELWSYIFLLLDISCLRNLALTCSPFRWLARPFLYRSLTVVCFRPSVSSAAPCDISRVIHAFQTAQRQEVVETLERLQFLTSPGIAPLIRRCSLEFQKWPDPSFEPVLNLLCDHLHRFTNLQKLEFSNVLITRKRTTDISTLSSLKELVFKDCMIQIDSSNSICKIRTQSLTISRANHPISDVDKPCWLAFVELDQLLELRLLTSRAAIDTLEELAETELHLPRLKSLEIERDKKSTHPYPQLSNIITKLPSLSQLHLLRKPEPDRPSEVTKLPVADPEAFQCCSRKHGLALYDGPHFLITSFHEEQLKDLRRVRLFGDRWGETCDMVGIRQDLWHLHRGAANLESMHLRAFHTSSICSTIASLFPELQSLAFSLPSQTNTQDPMLALTREPFLESLINMALPLNLKHLVILGMIFSDPTEGNQVIEALADKYDSLQHIFLYFPQGFWMAWSKTSSTPLHSPLPWQTTARMPHLLHQGVSICKHLDIPPDWF